jgi:hypothetical protein
VLANAVLHTKAIIIPNKFFKSFPAQKFTSKLYKSEHRGGFYTAALFKPLLNSNAYAKPLIGHYREINKVQYAITVDVRWRCCITHQSCLIAVVWSEHIIRNTCGTLLINVPPATCRFCGEGKHR